MTSFSLAVQSICLGVLGILLLYIVLLMRTGRLSAQISVSWILADVAAMAAVVLWGRLPLIEFTSSLGDRELLVILAVVFFALVAFLMLDSLQRISAQGAQIRRLTQELALLRPAPPVNGDVAPPQPAPAPSAQIESRRGEAGTVPLWLEIVLAIWVVAWLAVYVLEGKGLLPAWIARLLTANYLQ